MNTKTSIYDYDNDFAHYELDEKERNWDMFGLRIVLLNE